MDSRFLQCHYWEISGVLYKLSNLGHSVILVLFILGAGKTCFYGTYSNVCLGIDLLLKIDDKTVRSSRPEVFYKKGVLRNFAKFTGKRLCQSLFFAKFVRTAFLTEHLGWLLLNCAKKSMYQHCESFL